jgi:hypothetical protein
VYLHISKKTKTEKKPGKTEKKRKNKKVELDALHLAYSSSIIFAWPSVLGSLRPGDNVSIKMGRGEGGRREERE